MSDTTEKQTTATGPKFGKRLAAAGACSIILLAAGLVTFKLVQEEYGNTSLSPSTTICTYATEEQARWLLDRWFINPKYIEFNPLEGTCLLEVGLLADADTPDSSGYFYVLPGGKEGINGPIYNHRSKPAITIPGQIAAATTQAMTQSVANARAVVSPDRSTDIESYQATFDYDPATVLEPTAQAQPEPMASEFDLNKPFEPQGGETIPQALLRELKKSPYIAGVQKTELPAPAAQAYVLYDSNCPACTHLYQEMETIASEHNVVFNWVPGYLNEKGWVQAAHAIKVLGQSNEEAVAVVRDTFENPKSNEHVEVLASRLTEADYEKAKVAAAFLLRLNKMSPRILGTPLIFIEGPNGKVVSAYGAVTDAADWDNLVSKVQ